MVARNTKILRLALVLLTLSVTPLFAQTPATAPDSASPAEKPEGIALSLRATRDETDAASRNDLLGATRLLGFLLAEDELGPDCILVLAKEPQRPLLRFDDLAVAFQNVTSGDARPACTIDPRAETLRQLSTVAQGLGNVRDEQTVQRHLREWERIGKGPQDVQVFHVDVETHLAQVMVQADYDMKSICNGTMPVPGITSLTDRLAKKVQADIGATGTTNVPLGSQNRFWFNPGQVTYRTENRLLLLSKCEVVLLTEEEAITQNGERAGKSKPSPLAQQFANDMTQQFSTLAKTQPIFRELENLYRGVAIVVLMNSVAEPHRSLVSEALGTVDVPRIEFKKTLPGRVSVKKVQGEVGDGMYMLWLPSCGGVSMDIHRNSITRDTNTQAKMPVRAAQVVSTRPNQKSRAWKIAL